MREFFNKAIRATENPEVPIHRPTVLLKNLRIFLQAVRIIEDHVQVDLNKIIRRIFLEANFNRYPGPTGQVDALKVNEIEKPENKERLSSIFAWWFVNFITKHIPQVQTICYSPIRRGFISRTSKPFLAEEYCDIVELEALATLIGPYGVRVIDNEIVKAIVTYVTQIKDTLQANRQTLEELKKTYMKDSPCNDTLKKFKAVDNFVQSSIVIGNCLQFRTLLKEALQEVVHKRIPFIYETINIAKDQYPRNTFTVADFVPVDCYAQDCGIDVSTVDHSLKAAVARLNATDGDKSLWALLPLMYAAAFTSPIIKESQYRLVVEGHINNAHSMVLTIDKLIVIMLSVNNATDEDQIAKSLRQYVEVAAVILLRMKGENLKTQPRELASMFLFLDKFIQTTKLLTMDVLENTFPYTLLRNTYLELHYIQSRKKEAEKDQADMPAPKPTSDKNTSNQTPATEANA